MGFVILVGYFFGFVGGLIVVFVMGLVWFWIGGLFVVGGMFSFFIYVVFGVLVSYFYFYWRIGIVLLCLFGLVMVGMVLVLLCFFVD